VIKGAVNGSAVSPAPDAGTLHVQLCSLRAISNLLVVAFDEF